MPGPTLTNTLGGTPGFFGKLPAQGDFLSRRLPADFLRVWDPWLQTSLASSRERLGEAWLDAYLTSPIWRFILTPGIAGQSPWAGLLMPSVDRVGRYFPFTVACALPVGANPFRVLSASDWFDGVQTLMLAALEGSLTLDELDARLVDLDPPAAASPSAGASTATVCEARGWRFDLSSPLQLPELLPGLLHHALTEILFAYGVWWSEGSERVSPSLLVGQGLPAEAAFTSLCTGEWEKGNWWDLGQAGVPTRQGPGR